MPTLLLLAYLGGLLTLMSPCILPVLPFVFARAGRPFRAHGLPLLAGMVLAFGAAASLAALGGSWVASLHQGGRQLALGLLALFGLALLWPRLASWLGQPFAALGARLEAAANAAPLLLGLATGLLWAPCAGPILGLLLGGAALQGASLGSALPFLAYAAGAASALALARLLGGRLSARLTRASLRASEVLRRTSGLAVLAGVAAIAAGLDTGVLARLSLGSGGSAVALEQALLDRLTPSRLDEPAGLVAMRNADNATAPLAALAGASGWLNSPPLGPQQLRGKVVLVDFWTYSCINCLRTLPHLRAWAEKYREAGLLVLGVHTPEFAFEQREANVARAVRDLGIDFPVALDNNYAIWRAFGNRYWPAFYFVDAQGRIRHHQFGEGGYEAAERMLQQLLAEAGRAAPAGLVRPQGQGTQAAAGAGPALSGEVYLGHARAAGGFATPGGLWPDQDRPYPAAPALRLHQWALSGGPWRVEAERALLRGPNGRIALRFHARDLHLVLGPGEDGRPLRFRVRLDGRPPGPDHGSDIDAQGLGRADAQRLYQLVRQGNSRERLFEIEFLDPGAQVYAFTFG
ncbi:thioredoxin family protein [Roseateles sp. DAIF2]|uniref:thioredoxin family protein n=1 Tax=Roseateles sp. DAIF2 TaxID=2714952 RepID=UPI0018A2EFD6|nr:thioredoxin family protein [Roseateles sp. DAIF2]QPF75513.1 thioredoxin family protein [Roseateles sp. DAIF2]